MIYSEEALLIRSRPWRCVNFLTDLLTKPYDNIGMHARDSAMSGILSVRHTSILSQN